MAPSSEIDIVNNILKDLDEFIKVLDETEESKGEYDMNYQSVVQKDNELWINGKKIEQPKSLFFKNCVSQVNGKTYINGKEFKKGKWKYTLKSIFNTLF